ncbi:MAG: hypothetical protein DMF49_01425 [Acidobacteria bacterium]|nr:MAG: hypothetical protein DMF49_01425 [Acidobacteriota bacterium]
MRTQTLTAIAAALLALLLPAAAADTEKKTADTEKKAAQPEKPAAGSESKAGETMTDEQKTLYALGLAISKNLSVFNLSPAELELVKAGLTDGVMKRETKVDLNVFGPKISELAKARNEASAAAEKKASEACLAKAAADKGAVKTDSGLIMMEIKPGATLIFEVELLEIMK